MCSRPARPRLRPETLVASLALSLTASLAAAATPEAAPAWGTSVTNYVQIPPAAFRPRSAATDFDTHPAGLSVYAPTGLGEFYAPLDLPSGAQVIYLELDFYDVAASDSVAAYMTVADSLGESFSTYPTPYLQSGLPFAGGAARVTADIAGDNVFVDNRNNHYSLVAVSGASGTDTQLRGMIVGYRLRVSPPPATATFDDVPTNHPFFQFVEALKDSGITAGCSAAPPLYCPDQPVTRGQMAVFLAKALGLQFP